MNITMETVQIPDGLSAFLHRVHARQSDMQGQSIVCGTQINLSALPYKIIGKSLRAIGEKITAYTAQPWKFAGAWTSQLRKGGYHKPHNHPEGWISGCAYIDVPEPTAVVCGEYVFNPKAGNLLLFPSTVVHATDIYEGELPRLTVAFDVVRA